MVRQSPVYFPPERADMIRDVLEKKIIGTSSWSSPLALVAVCKFVCAVID